MARKTVDVKDILYKANYRLKNDKDYSQAAINQRRGVISLLETILMASDNYAGYGFLDLNNPDDTRRVYYYSKRLD